MDLLIVKSQVAGEARVMARSNRGRYFLAEHFGQGAQEVTLPVENVPALRQAAWEAETTSQSLL